MKKERIDDLKDVFQKKIGSNPFKDLISCLDHLFEHWGGRIEIKTRSEMTGDPLGYFGIFSVEKEKPVLFAGGMEKDHRGLLVPVIRFRRNNKYLGKIAPQNKFPFPKRRKEEWVCVKMNDDTISIFLILMDEEISTFLKGRP